MMGSLGRGGGMDEGTSFEKVVKELRLSPEEYTQSSALKEWVRRNKDEKYVPSDLLKAWGFADDDPLSGRSY
jgi:hypothetical protein